MKKLRRFKKTIGGLLAGIALVAALILIVSSVTAIKPTLSFDGLKFKVMEDGSIQASVDVCVEGIEMATGAYFLIEYNPEYLTPSDKATNMALTQVGLGMNDKFFAIAKDLYGEVTDKEPQNPFLPNPTGGAISGVGFGFCALDTSNNAKQIYIRCVLDQTPGSLTEQGKIKKVTGGGEDGAYRYYFDAKTEKTVIGTMTFCVDPEKIPDIAEIFSVELPQEGKYLLRAVEGGQGPHTWSLPYTNNALKALFYQSPEADILYRYQFSKTLISVAAAAPKVEVSAWQAYQTGGIEDIAATLRIHSPMVTAKYSTDHAAGNFMLPWGEKNTAEPLRKHDYKVYRYDESKLDHKGAEVTDYTPTGGKYVVEQYFYYVAEGETEARRFPLPVLVELTVNPITMTGVTADRLKETYRLTDAISTGTYSTYDSLELPNQARLMTDVLPGGATLSMPISGWNPGYTEDMTSLKNDTGGGWPILESDTAGLGTYTFRSADGAGTVAPAFTGADISARYPWLTVDKSATHALTATRTIVGDSGVVDAAEYTVVARHSSTTPGTMELVVERKGKMMAEGTLFKVLLPGGQELSSTWFTAENGGAYNWTKTEGFYTGIVTPGAQEGAEAKNRELVRRAINLGGWFSVSVQEAGIGQPSNFIPVYLAPRTNLYTENKTYHFTDGNTGLLAGIGLPGTTVTMPRGSYSYLDENETLRTEAYGVTTTYDGATGGEPGLLYTFAVDAWKPSGPIYGPNEFKSIKYGGYGKVDNTDVPAKTAEIRTSEAPPTLPTDGKLELSYEGTGTVTTGVDKRFLAVYDTKQVGYTYRQEYRFTLTNTGLATVSNIRIDPRLAYFQVLGDGPATSLAPGGTTTFVLTYAFDLKANDLKKFYFDTIDIESDGGGVLSFDAKFRVSVGPVRRVTVVTLPELTPPQSMGTAGLIVGETDTTPKTMDYTVSDSNYEETAIFWLSAESTDEYLVKRVYYYERNNKTSGAEITLTQYDPDMEGSAPLDEGTDVYFGEMPGYNVTVYVEFYEPVSSKLRLGALVDFAAVGDEGLKPAETNPAPQKLWQKVFTVDEAKQDDGAKLKLGKADAAKPDFDSQANQYLVVIPADATKSQVEVTLRKPDISYKLPDGTEGNPNIQPRVQIVLVGDKPEDEVVLYDSTATGTDLGYTPIGGDTATPTTHTGKIFDSPAEKTSAYVRVTLSANETIGETTNLIYRHYYLEIVRDTTEEVGTPGYGNSPYGMIMKATNIAAADKTKAKEAFVSGGYKFGSTYTPDSATAMKNTYWPEAWGGAITAETGNRDLDELAFFALLGQECVLPGITEVKDSSGRAVAPKDIKRTASVTLKDGREITLDLKTAADTGALGWQTNPDNAVEKYAVAPGAYTLRYTYVDYDGKTERAFTRPFVVLGAVGDMNADGLVVITRAADGSDLDVLQNRVAVPIPYVAENPAFRLRSCDVNNDRSINNIDANALQHNKAISAFYSPVSY